jgi:ribonucleoside-diphosphate reductase alpha chain
LTVYVTGSRDKVVLETKATKQAKEQKATILPAKKPRPRMLSGRTYRMGTPLGTTFVTINENGGGEPFEVFMHTSKAGSETYAVSEAMGRLISYILRLTSPIPPTERLTEVVNQLSGIGGGRPLGFGPNRILSLPDGVAHVLAEYLGQRTSHPEDNGHGIAAEATQLAFKLGDLCPDCGQASLVEEEGCRKCYSCGYSEC